MPLTALTLALLAAAPRALPGAEVVTVVPRLERLGTLLPFFDRAGAKSPVLRPEAWRGAAHPLVPLDVTSAETLAASGLDPAGPLTLSRLGDLEVSCASVTDPRRLEAASLARLERLGTVFRTDGGVPIIGARDAMGRVQAAYAVSGRETCAMAAVGRSVERVLPSLVKLVTEAPKPLLPKLLAEVSGVVTVVRPQADGQGVLALSADAQTATLEGKATSAPLVPLAGAGPSPFAKFAPPGVATLRLRVSKDQLPAALAGLAPAVPGGALLLPVARQLAPVLTGNVALLLQSVKASSGLRTREARFFATRLALVAETSDPAAAKALVASLDAPSLRFKEGTLEVGVVGTTVVFSNDARAREAALQGVGAGGRQAHGAELELDPRLAAKALAGVPLLEAMQSPELAAVLAVSTELGPLLVASEHVSGWLDTGPKGAAKGKLTWTLAPLVVEAMDAGVP